MSKFWALEGLRGDVVTKASLLRLDAFETPQLYDLMQRVSDGIGFRTKSITEALQFDYFGCGYYFYKFVAGFSITLDFLLSSSCSPFHI